MFGLNQLPRHNHPVFESDRFRAASDDRFFISIEAADPKFDVDSARALLEAAHATFVEVIEEDVVNAIANRAALVVRRGGALVASVAGCQEQRGEDPPILPERNMYDTERYNPESFSQFFGDHRTMRTPVPARSRASRTRIDPTSAPASTTPRAATW